METGFLGLVFALSSVYWFFRIVLSAKPAGEQRYELVGLVGCCTAILAASSFGWLFSRGMGELYFYSAGLVIALAGLETSAPSDGNSDKEGDHNA